MEWGAVAKNTGISKCLLTAWQRVGRGGGINLKHLDCERSLIFFCKVTARETQARDIVIERRALPPR